MRGTVHRDRDERGGGADGECVGNILARDMKEREQNDDQSRTTDSYREAKCR